MTGHTAEATVEIRYRAVCRFQRWFFMLKSLLDTAPPLYVDENAIPKQPASAKQSH